MTALPEGQSKLIIALDNLTKEQAREKIEQISEECSEYIDRIVFKVNDIIADIGLKGVKELFEGINAKIMLDPKWYDIPNTDANYIKKLANNNLGEQAEFVTMHASNGYKALKKAVDTKKELKIKTKILAVTALTTFDDSETNVIFDENSKHSVLKLAKEALEAGVDGIVCSPMEAQLLRDVYRDYNFEIITPGVRFEGGEKGDQKRVMTPKKAIEQGSSHIVMGRPILKSNNVKEAVKRYFEEIKGVGYASDKQRHEFERLLYTGYWEELLRYIGAFYNRPEGGKYCRLASGLLSNAYINIGATERNYLVVERAANEIAEKIKEKDIKADVIMGAQMGSVRISLYLAEKLAIEESIYTEKGGKDDKEMLLKRHDIDLKGKKVILSEDIVTKGSTLKKMIELVNNAGGEVVGITCIGNRYGKNNFEGIPLISCYTPPEFELYWDEKTPKENRGNHPKLPDNVEIAEKPKNVWPELHESMLNNK